MRARDLWVIGFILALVIIGAWLYFRSMPPAGDAPLNGGGAGITNDQSLSDGTITIVYSDEEWGLAVRPEQVPTESVIPPCGEDFKYCFYYIDDRYEGTNFESAGLRVEERPDLAMEDSCLTTLPDGYSNMTATVASTTLYATSRFAPLANAGAGHFSSGELYRLFVDSTCYEFETRIGESQFANFPEGSIEEFTTADKRALEARLTRLLGDVMLSSGARPFAGMQSM